MKPPICHYEVAISLNLHEFSAVELRKGAHTHKIKIHINSTLIERLSLTDTVYINIKHIILIRSAQNTRLT